jgi:hypothetical protein
MGFTEKKINSIKVIKEHLSDQTGDATKFDNNTLHNSTGCSTLRSVEILFEIIHRYQFSVDISNNCRPSS